jgi:class 3 adenylate cyclase
MKWRRALTEHLTDHLDDRHDARASALEPAHRGRLRFLVAAWTSLASLAIALTCTFVVARQAEQRHLDDLRANAGRLARSTSTLYSLYRQTGSAAERGTLASFLASAVSLNEDDPELAYVLVVTEDNEIVAGDASARVLRLPGVPSNESPARLLGHVVALGEHLPTHIREYRYAIFERDAQGIIDESDQGAVRIGVSTTHARAEMLRTVLLFGGLSLPVSLLVGLLLAWVVNRRVVAPVREVALAMDRVKEGRFDVEVHEPEHSDEIVRLVEGFNAMARGLSTKARLRHAFGQYVSEEVATAVEDRRNELVPVGRVKVSVVFIDVRGFTAFVGRHEPEEVALFLNEFFTRMVDIVHEHGGVVTKFMGDALMAVWGAPHMRRDDAERAVRAALQMQRAANALSKERRARKEEPFAVGVGVATGEAVAGSVGHPERLEYAVIGDVVNLARQLEHEAKMQNLSVLIAPETWEEVKDLVDAVPTPPMVIKGKGMPLDLFRVRGMRHPDLPMTRSGDTERIRLRREPDAGA